LIQGNNIGAEGARHISDALQHNSTITSIDLWVRVSHIEDSWGFGREFDLMIDLMSISLSHSITQSLINHQPLSLTLILFFFIDSLIH